MKHSVCIRCGKYRIVTGTKKEKVGNSTLVHTNTVCPDPECQKIVDTQLARELEKREANKNRNENRNRQPKKKAPKPSTASK